MGSSATIQSHPPPTSTTLSSLQGPPSEGAGSSNSSDTTTPPATTVSASCDPSISRTTGDTSRAHHNNSILKEGEASSVATAVSVATPDNSPFLPKKEVTNFSAMSVNSTTPRRTTCTERSATDNSSNTATAATPSSTCTEDFISNSTEAIMSASGHQHGNSDRTNISMSHSKAKSVTPQAKCVKFQESSSQAETSNDGVIISSSALTTGSNSDCGATAVSLSSTSQSSSNVASSSSLTLNLSSDSSENCTQNLNNNISNSSSNSNMDSFQSQVPTAFAETTKTPGTNNNDNNNISSIHFRSSVSRRGGKVTSPARNRAEYSLSSTASHGLAPLSSAQRGNTRNASGNGMNLNITPVKNTISSHSSMALASGSRQQIQEQATAAAAPSPSSSPSRIPSLQPRKLSSESMHVSTTSTTATTPKATTTSTTTYNDAASIPPSLCSSNSNTPENNNEIHGKSHQPPVQYLRHTVSKTSAHIKSDNDIADHSQNATNTNNDCSKSFKVKQEPGNSNSTTTMATTANFTNSSTTNNNNNIPIKINNRINSSSPVPPSRANAQTQIARTPIRSPKNSRSFNVDFGSPGIFLSPYLPSPPDSRKVGFAGGNTAGGGNGGGTGVSGNDRGHRNASPTNFAKDFGKTDLSSSSFDATNVLPWLSPTSYSLFSPGGGIASVSNTPGGMFSTSLPTPRSPNANKLTLPLTNDVMVGGLETKKKVNGISSMICVSPLASRKSANAIHNATAAAAASGRNDRIGKNGRNAATVSIELPRQEIPINFREVFASPKTESKGLISTDQSNEIPTLRDSYDDMCASLSLEKHMAERDVREDEDLNVLLKLAETTPNRKATEPKSTTRPFRAQFAYNGHPGAPATAIYSMTPTNGDPPASLHLPYIGKITAGAPGGNSVKKNSPESVSSDDFNPPPLAIRTNASSPSKRSKKEGEKAPTGKSPFTKNASGPTPTKQGVYSYPPPHMHHPQPPGVYPPPPPHYMHGPYYSYPHPGHPGPGHPPPPPYTMYSNAPTPSEPESAKKGPKVKAVPAKATNVKRQISTPNTGDSKKRQKKSSSRKGGKRQRTTVTQPLSGPEREKSAATITAINAATGNKNDKAASLASAILRGVTMRPSGKWQAQLYYAGKSRYIGVFDTREKAALAYEIAREKLKTDKPASEQSAQSLKETEANVNAARKAAFEGVNEKDPRHGK